MTCKYYLQSSPNMVVVAVTQQTDPTGKGHVELLLLHSSHKDKIGYIDEEDQVTN